MKKPFVTRFLSALLTVALLCGILAVLPFASAAEAASVGGYKVGTGYTSNWVGSSVVNKGYKNVIATDSTDGGWNGVVEILNGASFTYDSTAGSVTFTDNSTSNNVMSFKNMGTMGGVSDGIAVMKLDFYVPESAFSGFFMRYTNSGTNNLCYVSNTADSSGHYAIKWGSWASTTTSLYATVGWNTLYMAFLAYDSTNATLPVYMGIDNADFSAGDALVTEGDTTMVVTEEVTSDKAWYACSFAVSGIEDVLDLNGSLHVRQVAATGSVGFRRISVLNMTDTGLWPITFDGMDAGMDLSSYDTYIPADGESYTVTLPTASNVSAWLDAEEHQYAPGEQVTLSTAATFTPSFAKIYPTGYGVTKKYTSNWAGSSTTTLNNYTWPTVDGTVNGAMAWNSTGCSWDSTEGVLTIKDTSLPNVYIKPQQIGTNPLEAGAALLKVEFYIPTVDEGAFAGLLLRYTSSGTYSMWQVSSTGTDGKYPVEWKANWGTVNTGLYAETGWNTMYMWTLPYDSTNATLPVYIAVENASNPMPDTLGYTLQDLTDSDRVWGTSFNSNGKEDLYSLCSNLWLRCPSATGIVKIRAMEAHNMVSSKLLTLTYQDRSALTQRVALGATDALKIEGVGGNGLWTDGENYYKVGDSITLADDLTLKPLLLTGANLSLGGSMSMNMLFIRDAFNALGANSVFITADNGTSQQSYHGVYDGGNYYVFSIAGIAAADMGEDLTFTITIVTDAGEISSLGTLTYSTLAYAERMYNKYAAEEGTAYNSIKNVLTTMVQYGYMAETNRDGESTILDRFNEATGLNVAFNPEAYDASLVRGDADLTQLPEGVQMGATLTHGLTPVFTGLDTAGITEVIVTMGGGTFFYEVEGGVASITDLHAGMLRNKLEITFVGEDAEYSIVYSVANYLDTAVNTVTDENLKALVQATAIYMAAVRSYALGE